MERSEEEEARKYQPNNQQDQARDGALARLSRGLAIARFFLDFRRGHSEGARYGQHRSDLLCLFLEQAIKRGAGIIRVARRLAQSIFAGSAYSARGQGIPGDRYSW